MSAGDVLKCNDTKTCDINTRIVLHCDAIGYKLYLKEQQID